ncbi:MAG TPA: hypothetical protein VE056_08880, partial [Pyrinomonadaceae bacterium]|nr:hypothetical protein [Pyrinomonadaceae bacterium]
LPPARKADDQSNHSTDRRPTCFQRTVHDVVALLVVHDVMALINRMLAFNVEGRSNALFHRRRQHPVATALGSALSVPDLLPASVFGVHYSC